MNTQWIPVIIVVVIFVGVRMRRTMTSQIYRATTLWTRIVVLSALGVYVIAIEMQSVISLAGVAGGLIGGLVLGGYSLKHTTVDFQANPPRYRTNPYIGAVVVGLFVVRILYDVLTIRHQVAGHRGAVNPISLGWTAALLYFLFVAYWDVYYIGLLRLFRVHQGKEKLK